MSRGTQGIGRSRPAFGYGSLTLFGGPFQGPSPNQTVGNFFGALQGSVPTLQPRRCIGLQTTEQHRFGLFPVRSPLLGESFLFLGVLRCFSSPGSRRRTYVFGPGQPEMNRAGFTHSGISG